jgi:hypothetical protein
MSLLPLFLRREPPSVFGDSSVKTPRRAFDVVAYSDLECTKRRGRWPWWLSHKPNRRAKTVRLNCYKWEAVWLPDLEKEPAQ